MQPESTMRGLAAVIRRRDSAAALRASAQSFLAAVGVEGEDLDAMAEVGAERLLVYQRLVFNRFRESIAKTIPRTVARLGDARTSDCVGRFLEEQASSSPYVRDLGGEFVAWASERWPEEPEVPRYLLHLARHELLSFELASLSEANADTGSEELDLDLPLRFQEAARVVRYPFAVHRLNDDESDRTEPSESATVMLAYRDREHRVRFLELGATAAEILDALIEKGMTLRNALTHGTQVRGEPLTDETLAAAASLLADLSERGVLLGVKNLDS